MDDSGRCYGLGSTLGSRRVIRRKHINWHLYAEIYGGLKIARLRQSESANLVLWFARSGNGISGPRYFYSRAGGEWR